MSEIGIVIQARMSSSRLPGKVMMPLAGRPVLETIVDRLTRVKKASQIIVATSEEIADDVIAAFCQRAEISCYRGSLNNVLDRFHSAALYYNLENVIRVTADCPLIDPKIVDELIDLHMIENNDYTSNVLEPSFPDGLDAEIFKFGALAKAHAQAKLPSDLEHVTKYIYSNPAIFKLGCLRSKQDFSHVRWTLDEPEDFVVIKEIYQVLSDIYGDDFGLEETMDFWRARPDLRAVNSRFVRNEGLARSLLKDDK